MFGRVLLAVADACDRGPRSSVWPQTTWSAETVAMARHIRNVLLLKKDHTVAAFSPVSQALRIAWHQTRRYNCLLHGDREQLPMAFNTVDISIYAQKEYTLNS